MDKNKFFACSKPGIIFINQLWYGRDLEVQERKRIWGSLKVPLNTWSQLENAQILQFLSVWNLGDFLSVFRLNPKCRPNFIRIMGLGRKKIAAGYFFLPRFAGHLSKCSWIHTCHWKWRYSGSRTSSISTLAMKTNETWKQALRSTRVVVCYGVTPAVTPREFQKTNMQRTLADSAVRAATLSSICRRICSSSEMGK